MCETRMALTADINRNEPAMRKVWFLPLTGQEETEYDDHDDAMRASEKLCAARGVPDATPLSRWKSNQG